MPGSCIKGKANIKEWLDNRNDIKVIVDVGAGSGTYPKLLGKRYQYIGIEIWKDYVRRFELGTLYKSILVADIRQCALPEGDCIIFGDILEHLPKEDALKVLKKAYDKYKHLVVSIPVNDEKAITYSKIHYSNPNEAHISGWSFGEIKNAFKWEIAITSSDIGIFIK